MSGKQSYKTKTLPQKKGHKPSLSLISLTNLAFLTFQLAIEAITNIRTVAGLRVEAKYVQMYIDLLAQPHKLTLKKSHFRGFIFGLSQAMQFFAWVGKYLFFAPNTYLSF